jgi:hypothetical protein
MMWGTAQQRSGMRPKNAPVEWSST